MSAKRKGFNPDWKENYQPLSTTEIADASEMTRRLLQIVQKTHAEAFVNPEKHVIRIRTIQGKPAMQINSYTLEVPEVRIHIRARGDQSKAAEFFASANLEATNWKKTHDSGSHVYVGEPGSLIECVERSFGTLVQDAF